jgi:hypothetical protein
MQQNLPREIPFLPVDQFAVNSRVLLVKLASRRIGTGVSSYLFDSDVSSERPLAGGSPAAHMVALVNEGGGFYCM